MGFFDSSFWAGSSSLSESLSWQLASVIAHFPAPQITGIFLHLWSGEAPQICSLPPSCIFIISQLFPISSLMSLKRDAQERLGNWGNVFLRSQSFLLLSHLICCLCSNFCQMLELSVSVLATALLTFEWACRWCLPTFLFLIDFMF